MLASFSPNSKGGERLSSLVGRDPMACFHAKNRCCINAVAEKENVTKLLVGHIVLISQKNCLGEHQARGKTHVICLSNWIS